jgi:S1-C subfamily serine protease
MNFFKSKEFLTFLSVLLVTFIIGLTAVYAGEREDAIKDFARDLIELQNSLAPVTPNKPTDTAEFQKKAKQVFDPSVQLINQTAKGFCSGTIIESHPAPTGYLSLVYTARHCAKGMKDKFVVDFHGSQFPAKVLTRAEKTDTMTLVLESPVPLPVARVATAEELKELYFSQKVFNVSFPLGGTLVYSEGFLAMPEKIGGIAGPDGKKMKAALDNYDFIKANITMAPGSSGSCLFVQNAQGDYLCIGTATAIRIPFFYMGYFTPSNFLWDMTNGS